MYVNEWTSQADRRIRGARGKIISGAPMTSLCPNNKAKNRQAALQSVENTSKRGS